MDFLSSCPVLGRVGLLTVSVLLLPLMVACVPPERRSNVTGECETTLCCEDCPLVSVSEIIDGDTFESPSGTIRLFGIDTPERRERCYNRATRRFRNLAGDRVRIQEGPRSEDPGGRLLYYVFTERGESIDEKLIRAGLARAWTRDGQHRDFLTELEQEAQSQGRGCLW